MNWNSQANPMQLTKRIRRLQAAVPELRRGAEEVLAAKQVRAPAVSASLTFIYFTCTRLFGPRASTVGEIANPTP